MKLKNIVDAAPSLQKLIGQDLPIKTAYELMELTQLCNKQLDFYGREVRKQPSEEKLQELLEFECTGFEQVFPVKISLDSELRLSAADIKLLEPFVRFVEAE